MGLVFAILDLPMLFCGACCPPVGFGASLMSLPINVIALMMGKKDLRLMREGQMDPTGEGSTKGGFICALIGTILGGIGLVVSSVFMVTYLITMTVGALSTPSTSLVPPPGATQRQKQVDGIDADDFYDEFKDNEAAAKAKYAGKVLVIKGVTVTAEAAPGLLRKEEFFVVMDDGRCDCTFKGNNVDRAKALKKGDVVNFRGTFTGWSQQPGKELNFVFQDCEIVD
jgi:hypothetical protein